MEVRREVHESLSVHGHQVDNLSHRAGPTSLVAETKSLGQLVEYNNSTIQSEVLSLFAIVVDNVYIYIHICSTVYCKNT